jgi:hypothetical protein
MKPIRLSKSRYLSGCQCPLKLWYDCYARHLAPPPDAVQQAIFDTGHAVGLLAHRRYPGGQLVDVDHRHTGEALTRTKTLMSGPSVPAIFEGAFLHKNALVRADVLERAANGWNLIEVKSGTRVKEGIHDSDVAVQVWVLQGAGVALERAGVLTLYRDYVYDGVTLDTDQLFVFHDRTEVVEALVPGVERNIASFMQMLAGTSAPDIEPSDHCFDPYDCPYYGHCTRDSVFPDHPITELPNLHWRRRQELEDAGVLTVPEVPADFPLSERQEIVRHSVMQGTEYVSDALASELDAIQYPVYHLDFETYAPAIPQFVGTHPYDAIPFQFSVHIEREDGAIEHLEYLHEQDGDPRRPFAERLIDALGSSGSICVYTGYEARVISELTAVLPDLADQLEALLDRLWDLHRIVKNHYYHPGFHGSSSIKKVLPVLVPELAYDALDIQDGQTAAVMYAKALDNPSREARHEVFAALKAYCGLDTLAMLRLREALREIAGRS